MTSFKNTRASQSNTASSYDEDYFENGIASGKSLYENYQWLPELTIPMCVSLRDNLPITEGQTVLDYGCAKGYMVKGLRLLGIDAEGYDISTYAINEAPPEVREYLHHNTPYEHYDWVIAKDVLEHLSYEDLAYELAEMRCSNIFVAVPLGNNGKYEVPAYELDTTHVIRQDLDWWAGQLRKAGFTVTYERYEFPGMKEKWREHYPTGNGFLGGVRPCK